MVQLFVMIQTWLLVVDHRLRDDDGQTSAEYALVLLGAASVALLVALWAKKTDRIGKLLDAVFDTVTKLVK
jgi:Flp pilus assembly pilin Flp